jgi:predicted metal-dependent phosphoesterase TrpH
MIVFAGYELSKNTVSNSRSAHILGLGVTDWVSADLDPIEISKKLHDQGALCIAAHPVSTRKWEKQTYYLWDRRRELESHFDAWEVASGPYLFDEVLSERLPMIASSDLHVPRQFRSWKTSFECEKHPQAILEALRKQEVRFEFVELPNQILTAQRQAIV